MVAKERRDETVAQANPALIQKLRVLPRCLVKDGSLNLKFFAHLLLIKDLTTPKSLDIEGTSSHEDGC